MALLRSTLAVAATSWALFSATPASAQSLDTLFQANQASSTVIRGGSTCPGGAITIYNTTHASNQGAEITAAANGPATCMGDAIVVVDRTQRLCELQVDVFTLASTAPFSLTAEIYTDCTSSGGANTACGTGTGTLVAGSTSTVSNITPPALGTLFTVVIPLANVDISGELDNTITVKLNASRNDVFWRIGETAATGSSPDGSPSVVQRCGSTAANNGCARNFGLENNFAMNLIGAPAGADADLAVVLTDTPDPVAAGTNISYTATLTNTGPGDATNASVSLTIPAGTSFVSATADGGGTCTNVSPITCTWAGTTANGAVRTASVVVSVPASAANGSLINAAVTATSDTPDSDPADNTSTTGTAVITVADLSATLTDAPDPVIAGTQLTYTASLSNGGPSDAQNASLSLEIPAGTGFVSATAAGGACAGTTTVTCTWAGVTAPAASRSATIVVAVPADVPNGTILDASASATSDTSDPAAGNNVANATTTVIASADLSITLTDAPDPVTAGTQLTYTATVTNAGPSDATAVVVNLPTPTGTSFVSGTVTGGGSCAAGISCTISGSMAPGSSRTVTIVVLVAASVLDGTVINATATVTAGSTDPNAANNSASTTTNVIAVADLVIGLTASTAQVLINVPVTFTATSTNNGPSDAQNVSVTITLTPDFRYSSHAATGATCTTPQIGNTGAIVCTWAGATAPGATRTLTVVAYSNNEGNTAVNASTTSNTTDPVANNNAASVSVVVGFPFTEIPTLGQLGLLLLGLMVGLMGFVAVRRQG